MFGNEPQSPAAGTDGIETIDPTHVTSKLLTNLGYRPRAWSRSASGPVAKLVVIGRNALNVDPSAIAMLEPYVRDGGRVLICTQDPNWLDHGLGWRVCPQLSRRIFPMNTDVTGGLDAADLRDWTGNSTLIDAYPQYTPGTYLKGNEGDQPYAGWHWGNRGTVSSAAIEKPHCSGWRPLLECEFDLAYTPLMELDYGKGRVVVCTLDLEDHASLDPAARRAAAHIVEYALHSTLEPRASKVEYLGGPEGAAWLARIGVTYHRSAVLEANANVLLIGQDASVEAAALTAYLAKGGKAFFLPRSESGPGFDVSLKQASAGFAGSLSVPNWPEARGLSASDLRWRTHLDAAPWIVSGGAQVGADGLIGRKTVGKGVALYCQIDPDRFRADDKTYFRYSRWRSTRAVAQLLANLGASFAVDSRLFHPEATQAAEYYCPDYRTDFIMGDNPYRYYRW